MDIRSRDAIERSRVSFFFHTHVAFSRRPHLFDYMCAIKIIRYIRIGIYRAYVKPMRKIFAVRVNRFFFYEHDETQLQFVTKVFDISALSRTNDTLAFFKNSTFIIHILSRKQKNNFHMTHTRERESLKLARTTKAARNPLSLSLEEQVSNTRKYKTKYVYSRLQRALMQWRSV